VELTVRSTQPHILAKDLSGFDTVLAEYTTSFNAGDRNRAENLRLAASMINETVILPGDTFSLNQHLGQRTVERGFKEAGTIVDGELVPTPGGGVCQVATTIYNVVLLAGMQVTERQHHSRPIPYVPAGRDATISWGGPDLKFRNNLKHPVILLLSAQDGRLTARLLGNREDKVEVELVRSGFKTIPKVEQWLLDPTLKPGEVRVKENGRNGTQVTLSRIIKKNGRAMKTEILHTDVYKPAPKVVLVGPQAKSPSQEGTEAAGSKVWDAQTLPQVQTREGNVGSARRQGQNAPLRSGPQDR
jgi:vancomycin resistance protein YoaR